MSQQTSLKSVFLVKFAVVFFLLYSILAVGAYHLMAYQQSQAQKAALSQSGETLVALLSQPGINAADPLIGELLMAKAPDLEEVAVSQQKPSFAPDRIEVMAEQYILVKKLPDQINYVTLAMSIQRPTVLLVPLVIVGGLLFLSLIVFLSRQFGQSFRIFERINDLLTTVISQPSLKTVPLTETTYKETEELVANLNQMLAIVDEQNLKQLRFISDVSHELRTPVSVMKGYMSMLLRWGKEDPVVLEESLQASLKETSRMEIMIKDMLDMIRIQGSFEEHLDDVTEADESLEMVIANFKILYSNVVFNTSISDFLPLAKIYRVHLEQVLVILIDNAIKYSPAKKEIDLSLQAVGSQLELRVKDYGQGISQEDIKHIFDRFFRTSTSRNRQETSAGVGIGLSLLKQITDAYGITVQVASQVNQGTEFILTIPGEEIEPLPAFADDDDLDF